MEQAIKIGNVEFTLVTDATTQTYSAKVLKSHTNISAEHQLEMLNELRHQFVYQTIESDEETYTMHYAVGEQMTRFEQAKGLTYQDQLRLLLNIQEFRETLSGRINVILAPENLVYDYNLKSSGLYRGLEGLIEPMEQGENEFLQQYLCLIVATLSSKYSFTELYDGCLPLAKDSQFIREIVQATSVDQVIELLENEFSEARRKVKQTMVFVSRKRHLFFKRITAILGAALLLALVPLVYFALIREPYQANLLAADEAFLKTDYELVITKLGSQQAKNLPQASKYVLAYSYIQGEPLSTDQLTNIMATLSLKSDERYLLFWIYNGQNEHDQALDIAQALGDDELIIYSVYNNKEYVSNDTKMSGADKQAKIKQLDSLLEETKKRFLPEGSKTNESNPSENNSTTNTSSNN